MPDIIVIRGDGASQGEDIVDALLTTEQACIARGRTELDDASGLLKVVNECVYRDGTMLGEMVEVFDPLTGNLRRGKITSIEHKIPLTGRATKLTFVAQSEFVV